MPTLVRGSLSAALLWCFCVVPTLAAEPEKTPLVTAKSLLSAQLGQDVEIKSESVEQVIWPNGALGCPRAGMNYTQATVKGYRIVLTANERTYYYHGREGGEPFLCANPEKSHRWIMDR